MGARFCPAMQVQMPPPPPACPDGWKIAPPEFIGVGTMRSGTSWWHHLISCHPDVERPESREKELHYFDQFALRGSPDPQDYYRYFPRPSGRLAGEWTPRYVSDHWTPRLIAQVAPNAKILILFRDPIERLISGLSYIIAEGQNVSQAMLNLQLYRSLYWAQLSNLVNFFPREQILILQYEKCATNIAAELERTFKFIGLDSGRLTLTEEHRLPRNALSKPRVWLDESLLDGLRGALRADLRMLRAEFPEIDQSLWPSAFSCLSGQTVSR
jgi:hypothetical protein